MTSKIFTVKKEEKKKKINEKMSTDTNNGDIDDTAYRRVNPDSVRKPGVSMSPHISLYGVSADNLTKPSRVLSEKPARTASKSSNSSSEQPTSTTTTKEARLQSRRTQNSPRSQQQQQQVRFDERSLPTKTSPPGLPSITSTTTTVKQIASANPLLASQPAAPIVINTKLSGDSLSSTLDNRLRINTDTPMGQTSKANSSRVNNTINADLAHSNTTKLSATLNATTGFTKMLNTIRTEPNLLQNRNHTYESDTENSPNGTMPPIRQVKHYFYHWTKNHHIVYFCTFNNNLYY